MMNNLVIMNFFWQVMDLVVKEKLELEERRISLSEFHTADEVYFSCIHTKIYSEMLG